MTVLLSLTNDPNCANLSCPNQFGRVRDAAHHCTPFRGMLIVLAPHAKKIEGILRGDCRDGKSGPWVASMTT